MANSKHTVSWCMNTEVLSQCLEKRQDWLYKNMLFLLLSFRIKMSPSLWGCIRCSSTLHRTCHSFLGADYQVIFQPFANWEVEARRKSHLPVTNGMSFAKLEMGTGVTKKDNCSASTNCLLHSPTPKDGVPQRSLPQELEEVLGGDRFG